VTRSGETLKTQSPNKKAEVLALWFLSLVSFAAEQQSCRVRYLLVAPPSSSATMVLTLTFSIRFVSLRLLDERDFLYLGLKYGKLVILVS